MPAPKEIPTHEMRRVLGRICEKVRPLSCSSKRCPLAKACAVFGNPHTTDAFGVKAIYKIYQYDKT